MDFERCILGVFLNVKRLSITECNWIPCRPLWTHLIWWDAKWTLRGFHSQISKLTSKGCLRKKHWLKQWLLQVRTYGKNGNSYPCLIILFLIYPKFFWWQMLRTSGRIAPGAESWLCRRGEHLLMTLIGSRSCWQRSRFVKMPSLCCCTACI